MTLALGACGPVEAPEQALPSEGRAMVRQAHLEAEGLEELRLSPDVPVNPDATTTQVVPSVARAGDIYLVAWHEFTQNGYPDVLAARVRASDGVVLDTEPLVLATGNPIQTSPKVASDGHDFLVVWQQIGPSSPSIYGQRVRAVDGALLGGPSLISQDSWLPQFSPTVAYGDGVYLVAWQGMALIPSDTIYGPPMMVRTAFQGRRVRASDGQLLDSRASVIAVLTSSGSITTPSVAHAQGRFLVAWVEGAESTMRLAARRYSAATGAPLDPAPFNLNAATAYYYGPAIASDGSDFLVAWGDTSRNLLATRVRGVDGAVLDASGIQVGTLLNERPQLAFDGSDYRVIWTQKRPEAWKLLATRVSPSGVVASGTDLVLSTKPASGPEFYGAIATSGRGRFLVSYSREVSVGSVRTQQVFTRQVVDLPNGEACTGADECQSGSCVDGVCCESACGGGAATDCQACSVAAGGLSNGACTVVTAQAQVVCRGSAVACDVAEVCDGTSTLCPADEPAPREPDLTGDKCGDSPCDVAAYVSALGERSLTAKAEGACQAWRQGNLQATRGKLSALLHEVQAQRGGKLDASVADTLAAALTGMVDAL